MSNAAPEIAESSGHARLAGIAVHNLVTHGDSRGELTELYRRDWFPGAPELLQWNHVRSSANVLRGVHVHHSHEDFLFLAAGQMRLGLYDLRPDSPTQGQSGIIELRGDLPQVVQIPTGVAHGFYFPESAVLFYGVTHYWDPNDELGCRWDDPELTINWSLRQQPLLSARDQTAGSLQQMCNDYLSAIKAGE